MSRSRGRGATVNVRGPAPAPGLPGSLAVLGSGLRRYSQRRDRRNERVYLRLDPREPGQDAVPLRRVTRQSSVDPATLPVQDGQREKH